MHGSTHNDPAWSMAGSAWRSSPRGLLGGSWIKDKSRGKTHREARSPDGEGVEGENRGEVVKSPAVKQARKEHRLARQVTVAVAVAVSRGGSFVSGAGSGNPDGVAAATE